MATGPTCGQSGYITLAISRCQSLTTGTKTTNGYLAHLWATCLHHPCRLGGSQSSEWGTKLQMATSPTCGEMCLHHPCSLSIPNAQRRGNNLKWLPGPHVGKVATSALPSKESPMLKVETKISYAYLAQMSARCLHQPCHLGGLQQLAPAQKSQMAAWPICGQNGYINPAVLGVPNAQCRDKHYKWLLGPHVGNVPTPPLPSRGFPMLSIKTKIKNVYLAHMWATCLHHPCRPGCPQQSARGQQ